MIETKNCKLLVTIMHKADETFGRIKSLAHRDTQDDS